MNREESYNKNDSNQKQSEIKNTQGTKQFIIQSKTSNGNNFMTKFFNTNKASSNGVNMNMNNSNSNSNNNFKDIINRNQLKSSIQSQRSRINGNLNNQKSED